MGRKMVNVDITSFEKNSSSSMAARVLRSYVDMSSATNEFINEQPTEARLLFLVMLTNMFFVMSWGLKSLISPTAAISATVGADLVLWLVVAMMMRTTAIYATALFAGLACKVLGGKATVQETRAGVFWGVFVAAPIGLLIAGLAAVITLLGQTIPFFQSEGIQMMPFWLGLVPFLWFVSKGAATANRIESAVPLFGILSVTCVALGYAADLFGNGAL